MGHMARVLHEVDVEIGGILDPSLAKAIGMTDAELKRLTSAQKTFNSIMSKLAPEAGRSIGQIAEHTRKAESAFGRMAGQARKNFGEIGRAANEPGHRGLVDRESISRPLDARL